MKAFHLNTNSWHFRFMKWLWEIDETDWHNMCPYFWATVASIVFFIPLMLFLGAAKVLLGVKTAYDSTSNVRKRTSDSYQNFKQRRVVKTIQTGGEKVIVYGLVLTFVCVAIGGIILSGVKYAWWAPFAIIGGIVVLFAFFAALKEWGDDFLDWCGRTLVWKFIALFFKYLFMAFLFPFKLLYKGVMRGYEAACPPIVWDDKQPNPYDHITVERVKDE